MPLFQYTVGCFCSVLLNNVTYVMNSEIYLLYILELQSIQNVLQHYP